MYIKFGLRTGTLGGPQSMVGVVMGTLTHLRGLLSRTFPGEGTIVLSVLATHQSPVSGFKTVWLGSLILAFLL